MNEDMSRADCSTRHIDRKTVVPGVRVPEPVEIFDTGDAVTYIEGCDFSQTSDYAIVAAEITLTFGDQGRINGCIVEVCPGPGNLCGELLDIGAEKVIGIDGSQVMIDHARNKFSEQIASGQMEFVPGLAQQLPLPDDSVDGIVNFNSFHQFQDDQRAFDALREMVRVLKPGGWGLVRDFRRGSHNQVEFIEKRATRNEIKKLLADSLDAAFTSGEFASFLTKIPRITFQITDTQDPWRLPEATCARMRNDPVAHWMDSLISQHVIFWKI